MELYGDEWGRKGATLSDKSARAEFGLTQDEIIAAIRAGKLQYRPAAMHGNPWLRLHCFTLQSGSAEPSRTITPDVTTSTRRRRLRSHHDLETVSSIGTAGM
jgi:hypothetical protein